MPWKMSCDCALWRAKCYCENMPDLNKYKVVVVDPPWDIKWGNTMTRDEMVWDRKRRLFEKGMFTSNHPSYALMDYQAMMDDEIKGLPVSDLLHEDAWVFLWTTQGKLPHAFDVLVAWGLRYAFTMTWIKPFGVSPINRPHYNSEFILCGATGSPKFRDEKAFDTAHYWKRSVARIGSRECHSYKPEEFYDLLRRVTEGPRLDMFNRRKIAGFDGWGDESPGIHGIPDHYQEVMLG